jgi:mono/diheme cytochrome c family protein
MRQGVACLGMLLVAGVCIHAAQQDKTQEKAKDAAPAAETGKPAAETAKPASQTKNPVKATPEGIAAVKKIYGYDCAMCHGAHGDGKGDLVGSMSLSLKDWRDPGALDGISDEEMRELIVKGKGKMIGEGERLNKEQSWNMVHYVRSFAKKEGAEKAPAAQP